MRYPLILLFAAFTFQANAATYAQLNESDIVTRVVVINDAAERDDNGGVSEAYGVTWCLNFFQGGTWVRTANDGFRKNYAGIGYKYNRVIDAFVPPQPYPSWSLNNTTANWDSPVPRPNDGLYYQWDENSRAWVLQ